MIVLGLNAYHGDASACVLVDGRVAAAVEEERFTRRKHQAGFPAHAVRWVLQEIGADAAAIDHIAISRDPLVHAHRKLWRVLADRPSLSSLWQRVAAQRQVLDARQAVARALDVDPETVGARVHRVEHHRAHLASAFLCSPFDRAACVSLDGMGDFTSGMWGRGRGETIEVRGSVRFPHSLGVFYSAFTQFLGLPRYGDEYKLMGLAAHGDPSFLPLLRRILRPSGTGYRLDLDYFVHDDVGVDMTWTEGTPRLGRLWSERLSRELGPPRAPGAPITRRDRDLAASVQARLQEVELVLLRRIHAQDPDPRLVLAGGVALNCVVNGMIRRTTPFERVWVQPAANDAGTSLGAALWVWHQVLGRPRSWRMTDVFLGPGHDQTACDRAVKAAGLEGAVVHDENLFDHLAVRLAEGAVVGWFQGRSPLGPRALGNRSIVADPRRPDMREILNHRIKQREPFRPFAPSVLAEATGDWFEQDHPSPWMNMTYRIRPSRRPEIPAVTHEDGTGRLQTVERQANPRWYDLIAAFGRATGVPLVLNTSFNQDEPIVNTPEEAVDCFLRTGMDVLVLGNRIVERGMSRRPDGPLRTESNGLTSFSD